MKTRTTISSIVLALAIGLAGCSSSDSDPNDPNPPQPGNAYLTVVGDTNVFLETSWRQTITVKYHDGSDQPLAGQIDFSVVGNSGGGTITSPTAVTNSQGLATIDVIAGAEGEAVFTIRADAEYADGVEWRIAVNGGTPPLPPLDPTGRYTVSSDLDIVSGLPGTVGDVVNGFIDMTDGPYDPATWLIDVILDEVDSSTVSSVVNSFRPVLDGVLNDLLLSLAPGFVQDLLDIGDAFGQVARHFGVTSTLDVHAATGIEGDELQATHTMTAMFFNIDSNRYTYNMTELGVGNQERDGLSFRMENENKVFIGEHAFNMPYGALLLVAMNDVIIPMVDPFAGSLSQLLSNAIDCTAVGYEISEYVGFGSPSLYEGACELGMNAAAAYIEDQIRSLQGMDLNLSTGEAKPMDTNTDAKVDVLLNGAWSGNVSYFGSASVLSGATFRGERQHLP
ncbi:MAG TPA: hypothetical protein VML75_01525 [Kofleriaceae bacterium]|nr:hypothetical protein [Kofleriaceae bacterium]